MEQDEKLEALYAQMEELNPDALKPDGLEGAIVGIAERCGMSPLFVIDRNKCIAILQEEGMSEEEAVEYFEFNVIGAYVGEHTPLFFTAIEDIIS